MRLKLRMTARSATKMYNVICTYMYCTITISGISQQSTSPYRYSNAEKFRYDSNVAISVFISLSSMVVVDVDRIIRIILSSLGPVKSYIHELVSQKREF